MYGPVWAEVLRGAVCAAHRAEDLQVPPEVNQCRRMGLELLLEMQRGRNQSVSS